MTGCQDDPRAMAADSKELIEIADARFLLDSLLR